MKWNKWSKWEQKPKFASWRIMFFITKRIWESCMFFSPFKGWKLGFETHVFPALRWHLWKIKHEHGCLLKMMSLGRGNSVRGTYLTFLTTHLEIQWCRHLPLKHMQDSLDKAAFLISRYAGNNLLVGMLYFPCAGPAGIDSQLTTLDDHWTIRRNNVDIPFGHTFHHPREVWPCMTLWVYHISTTTN